ncbi:MAG: hypothetical protein M3Q79_04240, partial [bacterium]|nr:hypothetical protein [bacterium]
FVRESGNSGQFLGGHTYEVGEDGKAKPITRAKYAEKHGLNDIQEDKPTVEKPKLIINDRRAGQGKDVRSALKKKQETSDEPFSNFDLGSVTWADDKTPKNSASPEDLSFNTETSAQVDGRTFRDADGNAITNVDKLYEILESKIEMGDDSDWDSLTKALADAEWLDAVADGVDANEAAKITLNYMENKHAELLKMKDAHSELDEHLATLNNSSDSTPTPSNQTLESAVTEGYRNVDGKLISTSPEFVAELRNIVESKDTSRFEEISAAFLSAAEVHAKRTGYDMAVDNTKEYIKMCAEKLGLSGEQAESQLQNKDPNTATVTVADNEPKIDNEPIVIRSAEELIAESDNRVDNLYTAAISAASVEELDAIAERLLKETVENQRLNGQKDTSYTDLARLDISLIRAKLLNNNKVGDKSERSSAKEKKRKAGSIRTRVAAVVGIAAALGAGIWSANNHDSENIVSQSTEISQPAAQPEATTVSIPAGESVSTEASADTATEAPVANGEAETANNPLINLEEYPWENAERVAPGHADTIMTVAIERYNAAHENASFSLIRTGDLALIVNQEGRQVNEVEMKAINSLIGDVGNDLANLPAES